VRLSLVHGGQSDIMQRVILMIYKRHLPLFMKFRMMRINAGQYILTLEANQWHKNAQKGELF